MSSILFDGWITKNNATKTRNALDIWNQIEKLSTPQTPFAFPADQLCRLIGLTEDEIVDYCEHILAHGINGFFAMRSTKNLPS